MSFDNTIDFKDHIVQYPNRFKQTTVAPGVVELVPTWITNSNEIIEPGTPVDSELFKKLKQNVTIYQQTFTTTENQTVINLNRDFLVGQNRVSLSIGGVRQYAGQDYTETDSHTLTMTTPQKGGLKAEVIMFTASQAIAEDFFEKTVAAIEATQSANDAATQALAAKETAYTVQLTPVANFATIATTYPTAVNGSEVQTLDDGKIYRKESGSWVYRKALTPGPVANLIDKVEKQKYYLSVKEFGAVGDGVTDDTAAITAAINYCVSAKRALYFPGGDYRVTATLPFPNYIKVFGAGDGSNIVSDFSTSGLWIFEESIDVYRWDLQDLRFTIKSGSTKDVGILKTQKSLRYATIKNIRVFDYKRAFSLGAEVFGILSIDKLGIYYLSGADAQTALEVRGNTVMMSDLEIIGGYSKGLYMVGASVFKLDGYNIAGTPGALMKNPIHIETSKAGSIDSGWIEQLDETGLSNGESKAMYFKDSNDIKVTSALLATGSIWVDGGDLTVENIEYSQTNGGVRYQNGARITASKTGLKRQNVSLRADWADGIVEVYDITKNSRNLLTNPTLRKGAVSPFTASTGNVTLTDSTDKLSGDRAIQFTSTANFQGARLDINNLIVGKTYTLRAKVKKVSGVDYVTIAPLTGTTSSINLPSILAQSKRTDYHDISYTFTTSVNSVALRIQLVFSSGMTSGSFLMDSVGVFEGYSEQDTSSLIGDRLISTVKPFEGTWTQGETVYNSSPSAGGYLGWVCILSGTPGTWKGFGMIET